MRANDHSVLGQCLRARREIPGPRRQRSRFTPPVENGSKLLEGLGSVERKHGAPSGAGEEWRSRGEIDPKLCSAIAKRLARRSCSGAMQAANQDGCVPPQPPIFELASSGSRLCSFWPDPRPERASALAASPTTLNGLLILANASGSMNRYRGAPAFAPVNSSSASARAQAP
jgi:hypothetical protein